MTPENVKYLIDNVAILGLFTLVAVVFIVWLRS